MHYEPLLEDTGRVIEFNFRKVLEDHIRTRQTVFWDVDPDMALEMLRHNQPNAEDTRPNRPYRLATAARMAQDMRAGKWLETGEPIIFASNGRLNNGQHRLNAVVLAQVAVPLDIRFGASRKAMVATDTGRKRTSADHLTIEGEDHGVVIAAAIRLYKAFLAKDWEFNASISPLESEEMLAQFPGFRGAAALTVKWGRLFPEVPRSVWTLCFYCCAQKDRTDAMIFFEMLATGVGIESLDHPANVARRFFISAAKGHGYSKSSQKIPIVFKAWNAFRRGETRSFLRVRRAEDSSDSFPLPI